MRGAAMEPFKAFIPPEKRAERVAYVVMGEDGYYTFADTWAELPRQLGELHHRGFILIGIDGVGGFSCAVPD